MMRAKYHPVSVTHYYVHLVTPCSGIALRPAAADGFYRRA
ncbi:hypothetical protein EPYR_02459 [Erwinia pyrifoliae DSM 12163]|nr:hypothetical protein EPYR_02459 [Erwinia pyrifoliae DSM 12163]